MNSTAKHTVRAFDDEIDALRSLVAQAGSACSLAITDAMKALDENDLELAQQVVEKDQDIDALERQIDELSIQTIALRSPMADDLRHLVAIFKISSIAERIGDYAKNIAKRVPVIANKDYQFESLSKLPPMAEIAINLVDNAFKSYSDRNVELAVSTWASDQALDDQYTIVFRSCIADMNENPRHIGSVAHLLFVAKNLERIGDHATNIAELTYFAETGNQLLDRNKGENVSSIWPDDQETDDR